MADGSKLTDKRVLLLGAETDLGRAIAGALAEAGARVALVGASNDAETAFAVQRLARKLNAEVSQAIDATNDMAVRVMVRQVSKSLAGLEALVWVKPPLVTATPTGDMNEPEVRDSFLREMESSIREVAEKSMAVHGLLLKYGGRELERAGGGPIVVVGQGASFAITRKGDPEPKWWLVEVEPEGRSAEEVAKRVALGIRSGKPRLWPRILYWRTIGRAVRFFRGLTDYQYRS